MEGERQLAELLRRIDGKLNILEGEIDSRLGVSEEKLDSFGRRTDSSPSHSKRQNDREEQMVRDGRKSPRRRNRGGGVRQFADIVVDLPTFDGTGDPEDWCQTTAQLLAYHQQHVEDWVTLASIKLQGVAAQWFRGFSTEQQILLSWGEFVETLVVRFGGHPLRNYEEEMYKLQQHGSVADYLNEFDALSTRVPRMAEHGKVACFVGGLREEIRKEVMCSQPANMAMAILMAKSQESREEARRRNWGDNDRASAVATTVILSSKGAIGRKSSETEGWKNMNTREFKPKETTGSGSTRKLQFTKISLKEEQRRREMGFCFKCDQKFHEGHICKSNQLYLITQSDDEDVEVEEEVGTGERSSRHDKVAWKMFGKAGDCFSRPQ